MIRKYTPKPWQIEYRNGCGIYSGDKLIARIDCTTGNHEEEIKNGNLMCAAPDLLEAAKDIENDDNSIPDTIWNNLQSAISKAEGGE